ncbi:MAG: hypoxanthine phosphoribosyltransferase [Chloroflexota bacterium]|nr:hypoxanthine phosphoribosyltransferase [Chloroflexota bacterium]
MERDVSKILISNEEIQAKIAEMGRTISEDYQGRDLLLVCVLKGAFMFLADLMRHITIPHEIDFMATASYGRSTESSGIVRILKDLNTNVEGRDILVTEDIVDTGLTLKYLLRLLRDRNPASLRVCCLLDKKARRKVEVPLDYVGFTVPNEFVVGYGLDYGGLYRNLPYVGILKPELYEE